MQFFCFMMLEMPTLWNMKRLLKRLVGLQTHLAPMCRRGRYASTCLLLQPEIWITSQYTLNMLFIEMNYGF